MTDEHVGQLIDDLHIAVRPRIINLNAGDRVKLFSVGEDDLKLLAEYVASAERAVRGADLEKDRFVFAAGTPHNLLSAYQKIRYASVEVTSQALLLDNNMQLKNLVIDGKEVTKMPTMDEIMLSLLSARISDSLSNPESPAYSFDAILYEIPSVLVFHTGEKELLFRYEGREDLAVFKDYDASKENVLEYVFGKMHEFYPKLAAGIALKSSVPVQGLCNLMVSCVKDEQSVTTVRTLSAANKFDFSKVCHQMGYGNR